MCSLLNHKSDIPLNHIGPLLTLPLKQDLIVILHTPLNINQELLRLINQPLTSARGALLRENFTFSFALGARLLHLHLHHAHIHFLGDLAAALTCGACFEITTLCSRPFTLGTVDIPIDREFLLRSIVQLLE